MDYTAITLKFIIGMLALILQINLFGKKNLAPSSPIDQIQNFVLGGIIGGIIYNEAITIMQFAIILLIWTLIVFIIYVLKARWRLARILIDGQPINIIRNGQIQVKTCVKNGITANEIMMHLRSNGINDTSQVKSAFVDANGQFVVIENNESNVKFPLINDGQINYDVLDLIHKDEEWLNKELAEKGFTSSLDVYLAEYVRGRLVVVGYPQ
ncbi:DUF421 domain-containing protein [Lactobacillus psittaci]|uniref:Membrane protein yetF n=1 Tax=Lactobacillus psittaci DSM 15354 TaxID=1122152 RepID=A0A0R1S5K1_9LACO|nr:DUF421 domain-containing protein [Lactobacillus psittaci]KRL62788.1 hypothetical protein FC23_GL001259 [Lactobacillus psittaci DSM 15354]